MKTAESIVRSIEDEEEAEEARRLDAEARMRKDAAIILRDMGATNDEIDAICDGLQDAGNPFDFLRDSRGVAAAELDGYRNGW